MNNLRRTGIPPWVPTEMLVDLDLTELAATDTAVLRERELLSFELGVNVAAFHANAKGRPHGLCSVYRAAELTATQIQRMHISERKFVDVVFVAYCKPSQRHNEADVC